MAVAIRIREMWAKSFVGIFTSLPVVIPKNEEAQLSIMGSTDNYTVMTTGVSYTKTTQSLLTWLNISSFISAHVTLCLHFIHVAFANDPTNSNNILK